MGVETDTLETTPTCSSLSRQIATVHEKKLFSRVSRQGGSQTTHPQNHQSSIDNGRRGHYGMTTGSFSSHRWLWLAAIFVLSSFQTATATSAAAESQHLAMYEEASEASPHNILRLSSKLDTTTSNLRPSPQQQQRQEEEGRLIYYETPTLAWMVRLEGNAELQKGNAIVPSPYYDQILYVTTVGGQFLVRSAVDGTLIYTYTPPTKQLKDGDQQRDYSTRCYSSVAFGESDFNGKFVVYAVVYEPPEGSSVGPTSKVVAFSIPNHELLWESADLPGVIQGTPVVNTNHGDPRRTYVVITRNTNLNLPDGSDLITGHLTILESRNAQLIWTQSETVFTHFVPQGYGPPGIASSPAFGNYAEGMENDNDMIVWANNADEGQALSGNTFAFQLPQFFHEGSDQLQNLTSVRLKEVRWTSATRPVLTQDGQSLFIGVSKSQLRGWTTSTRFDATANWSAELQVNSAQPLSAIPAAPVLSVDEKRLFVSSASNDFSCLDAASGKKKWDLTGQSPFFVESKVSPDDTRVYSIQSADGRVSCQDQLTGELLWIINCDQYFEDCANSVWAEFGLSANGKYLYYGDVVGRIMSLKLGELVSSSARESGPVNPPTLVVPISPTDSDWSSHAQSSQNRSQMKRGPTLGGSIALIVIATLIGIGAAMYIVKVSPLKTHPHPQQEPHCYDEDDNRNNGSPGDFEWENRLQNTENLESVPDPYEDAMLCKHSPSKERSRTYLPTSYETPPRRTAATRKDDDGSSIVSASSVAAADRLSQLLGTSNQILPIPKPGTPGSEDYSFGASLIL